MCDSERETCQMESLFTDSLLSFHRKPGTYQKPLIQPCKYSNTDIEHLPPSANQHLTQVFPSMKQQNFSPI